MTQFLTLLARGNFFLVCLFLLISCYEVQPGTAISEQDVVTIPEEDVTAIPEQDVATTPEKDKPSIYEKELVAVPAQNISTSGAYPDDVELSLSLEFLPEDSLSASAKQKVKVTFHMEAFTYTVGEIGPPSDDGFVELTKPEDFDLTIGEESFDFDGVQEWRAMWGGSPCSRPAFGCLLASDMVVELAPDNTADQFVFTLNPQDPIRAQINLPYEDPAFSAAIKRDSSTGGRNMELTFSDGIIPESITTQFVMVDEDGGQPMLNDANIQSRCAFSNKSIRGAASPLVLTLEEPLEYSDPCSTYNAALVRLTYRVPGLPIYIDYENGFDDFGLYFTRQHIPRFATIWVPLPE